MWQILTIWSQPSNIDRKSQPGPTAAFDVLFLCDIVREISHGTYSVTQYDEGDGSKPHARSELIMLAYLC